MLALFSCSTLSSLLSPAIFSTSFPSPLLQAQVTQQQTEMSQQQRRIAEQEQELIESRTEADRRGVAVQQAEQEKGAVESELKAVKATLTAR